MSRKQAPEGFDENPQWTKEDFAKAVPFADAFPDLAAKMRGGRDQRKAPAKIMRQS